MKFGFRKPSFKKSLSAATRGVVNRAIKKAIIPGYGQKGMGIANPKKYLYNSVYSMTTIDTVGLLTEKRHCSNSNKSSYTNSRNTQSKPAPSYHQTQKAIEIRGRGQKQCKLIFDLTYYCRDASVKSEAINKLYGRASKYLSKGVMCGEDLYQFAKSDLEKLIETAARTSTINECKIAISVINQLQNGACFDDVITSVKEAYAKLEQIPTPPKTRTTLPIELLTNPNGSEEAMAQHKILMEFAEYKPRENYGLFVLEARVKLFSCCCKRRPDNINLFDFVRFKLHEKADSVKKEKTKAEYILAIQIVDMLDQDVSMEQIFHWLDEVNIQHK